MIQWFMKEGSFFSEINMKLTTFPLWSCISSNLPNSNRFHLRFLHPGIFPADDLALLPVLQTLSTMCLLTQKSHACVYACTRVCLCVSTMWGSTPVNHNFEISDKPRREGLEGDKTGRNTQPDPDITNHKLLSNKSTRVPNTWKHIHRVGTCNSPLLPHVNH